MPHAGRARAANALTKILLCEMLFLQPLLLAAEAVANPTHPGKWTTSLTMPATAVNLILLPGGSSGYQSRVLWWQEDDATDLLGGVYEWNPPDDASTNAGTFPQASFQLLGLDTPPPYNGGPPNLFCSGQTMLADGRLLVTGGTNLGETGSKSGLILDPAADANGAWTRMDNMANRRWYADNTLLPDGRVVTASGSTYLTFMSLGGLTTASPDTATRLLQRMGVDQPGQLEASVVPLQSSPPYPPLDQVSDAAVASVGTPEMTIFGGRNASGTPTSNAFKVSRHRNEFGADYVFDYATLAQSGTPPAPRYGALLVALGSVDEFVLIGGRNNALLLGGVWRGRVSNNVITWTLLNNYTPSTPLPALHGLCGVYDKTTNRVFVFGGANSTSDTPTNGDVYSLQLGSLSTSDTLMVTLATATTATGSNPPGPMSYGSLSHDSSPRSGMFGDLTTQHDRALLFGGYKADGTRSDALYSMWIKSATEVVWEQITPDTSARPTGRARHAAAVDANTSSLVVYGGETAPGQSTAEGWMFSLSCGSAPNRCDLHGNHHWWTLPSLPLAVRGSAGAVFGTEPEFSRYPEVFMPGATTGQQWTTLATAPHWQEYYPFGFASPRIAGDASNTFRVFYAGAEQPSSFLKVTGNVGQWVQMSSNGPGNFPAGSAVMYRPGKVMKCGTRDTDGVLPGEVVGRTAVIDLKAGSPTWVEAADQDSMIHRRCHNLVILPTGEVVVIGGGRWGGNDQSTNQNCVFMPQIWNPDTLTAGHWYGQEPNGIRFDPDPLRKHYHSTALLLPDGRILSAGGASDPSDEVKMNLYSPYYLFNSNGTPATRPVITGAPAGTAYGRKLEITVSPGGTALSSVALIRPGATTHGFDQDQRFVPLVFSAAGTNPSGDQVYCATAPSDSFDAPPGDYMLFALNANNTPSLARWVRLGTFDGDTDHPTRVQDLSLVTNSYSSSDQGATVQWTPPYEDSLGSCRGPASAYHIRYRYGSMAAWSDFAAGTPAPNLPAPGAPGGPPESYRLTGLSDGVEVHMRLVSKNRSSAAGNWSAMSNELVFYTPSSGGSDGGGEGEILHVGTGEASALASVEGATAPSAFQENTIFPASPAGQLTTDRIPLPNGPHVVGGRSQVLVSRWGRGGLVLHDVKLVTVDHALGEVFAAGSTPVTGTFTPAAQVHDASGADLTASLAAGTPYESQVGDVLTVHMSDARAGTLVLTTSGAQAVNDDFTTGVSVQVPTAGGWDEVALIAPRELPTDAVVNIPAVADLRLVFRGNHRLHAVGRVVPVTETPTRTSFAPVSATHSVLGDVLAQIAGDGALLTGGQSVIAEFTPTAVPTGRQRDWFLEVTGVQYHDQARAISGTSALSRTESEPTEWALHPARPNPFSNTLAVPFDLPRAADVSLEVYDLLGRRVAVLAQGTWPAGRHAVTWDGHTRSGSLAAPGVYSVRLRAGSFHARRQVVRMP